jgi:hypothetical protein
MAYALPVTATRRIATAYCSAAAITPTDNTQIGPYEALYVGAAGNVALCPLGQTNVVTFVGVAAGTVLPIACQGVNATNTTASNIVGLG